MSASGSGHVGAFRVIGPVREIEAIAVGRRIRELPRLVRQYGQGRWRKCKGVALVRLPDGTVQRAELHWYEATGVGRKETKIKRYLND